MAYAWFTWRSPHDLIVIKRRAWYCELLIALITIFFLLLTKKQELWTRNNKRKRLTRKDSGDNLPQVIILWLNQNSKLITLIKIHLDLWGEGKDKFYGSVLSAIEWQTFQWAYDEHEFDFLYHQCFSVITVAIYKPSIDVNSRSILLRAINKKIYDGSISEHMVNAFDQLFSPTNASVPFDISKKERESRDIYNRLLFVRLI